MGIELILGAIASGIAEGALSEAGKQAYQGLKNLMLHKFANKPKAQQALANYEEDPETHEKPLRKVLEQEQVDQDPNIVEAAKKVMMLIQPQQAAQGKYNVQITGKVQGYAQGDRQQNTMYFGRDSGE